MTSKLVKIINAPIGGEGPKGRCHTSSFIGVFYVMNIEKLQPEFIGIGEVKGLSFKKVFEDEKHYIYKVENEYYELFIKKTTPKCIDFSKRIYSETEFKEIYPKAKDFGIWAWTFDNIELCHSKIERLNKIKCV